jgi:hypothetical protein
MVTLKITSRYGNADPSSIVGNYYCNTSEPAKNAPVSLPSRTNDGTLTDLPLFLVFLRGTEEEKEKSS